jgi:cobyrinic acid a,c-diamide synthase
MKGIIISSNASGGGKTTVTLGLMKALLNRGFKIQGYKVGPDYIDTAFHSKITGISSRNLDLFLMGEEGVKASFSRGKGDLAVVEGVMGLYDGKGIDESYSTYHVSKILDLPIILVLSPKAQVATLCAEINGIVNFKKANIAGIILNNVSESYYNLLKRAIEVNCNLKVFGYLPKNNELVLKSRHLGLVQSSEIEDLDEKIQLCAQLLERYVDIDSLLKNFGKCVKYSDDYHIKNKGLKIGVALDEAFSFYYKENLELLQEAGQVVYFSPLKDKRLPEGLDFIYLGGGYPEVFIQQLSENKSMLKSIYEALNNGIRCYTECGGLMYLTSAIDSGQLKVEDENIKTYDLVGFFEGNTYITKRLQNFGYAQVEIVNENPILPKGLKINCHEFHKSYVDLKENSIYKVEKKAYDGTIRKWECGYLKKNTLGAYAHVHFFGNMNWLEEMLNFE